MREPRSIEVYGTVMGVFLSEGLRLRSGRYELRRRLGAGAAATVWLATDTLLERPVAIKLLSEGLTEDRAWLARFRREARVAARLQHPNLVSIYDFDAEAERPYLVMAYLPGGSLQDHLDAGAEPDPERLAGDLLSALAHIHAAGIIHRDVKPANVLLDGDGRACLTDFGVARPQDATAITQTGQIPGTARYMAPELWRGEQATERTDLYSCGLLLSECLTDDAPRRLVALVGSLRADEPDLRPESAAAALAELGASAVAPALASPPGTPPEGPSVQSEPPVAGSGPARWLPVAALCAVALVAGIAFASALGDDEPPVPEPRTESDGGGGGTPDKQPADQTPAETTEEPPASDPPAEEASTDPFALSEQGHILIEQGLYDDAIPVLQQAVDGLRGSGDITYAYSLYDLAHALRLAGQPAEAIPLLEERLGFNDQREVVAAELKQAEKELKAQEKAAKSGDEGDD